MIVSDAWLREWIDLALGAEEIADTLTLAGLEVESVSPAAPPVSGVVVGRVRSVESHPGADRLRLCNVDAGGDQTLRIVCGADNVAADMFVAVALPGARLPGGAQITVSSIRGVESEGMLCSAGELGLDLDVDLGGAGILELDQHHRPGQDLVRALQLDDQIIDIDLTPNRGDCLSVLGVARELRVLAGGRLKRREVDGLESTIASRVPVRVSAPAACPRYLARVIEGLDVSRPSPLWMRERLRRAGLRPINPAVDVTNYVMLELGQPMHAFDRDRLNGGIVVRMAKTGEAITLLDGTHTELRTGTLLITDNSGPIAIGGVMGGADSAIHAGTTAVVLEAAHFTRRAVSGQARRYGLQTDSAHRFERGVDPHLPFAAMHYASYLLTHICGGQAGPVVDRTRGAHLRRRAPVSLRHRRLRQVMGFDIPKAEVGDILRRVAGRVRNTKDGWSVTPPSWRFDIERECDLVEEVARVKGYDAVPVNLPRVAPRGRMPSEARRTPDVLRSILCARGYQEAITYSFVEPRLHALLNDGDRVISLANPLAENLSEMRTTLWPGLLAAARANLHRQHERVRLFEIGHVFSKSERGRKLERSKLAGIATGKLYSPQWGIDAAELDFYDVKSDVEALLGLTNKENSFTFRRLEHKALHPGQVARIERDNAVFGWVGRLHPDVERDIAEHGPVFLFELDLERLLEGGVPDYAPVSRFPAVKRDLGLELDASIEAGEVASVLRDTIGDTLVSARLFDVYSGKGVREDERSLTYRLTFQHDSRTLTDREVEQHMARALAELNTRFGASLRGA